MTEEVKDQDQSQAASATGTQDAINLTIQDLAGLKTVIDVASQRGAFKPGEMAAVGLLYNKLVSFLESVTKEKEAS